MRRSIQSSRRGRAFFPAALAFSLLLGACSGGESTPETEVDSSAKGNVILPTVAGGFGEEPKITFPDGEPSDELEVQVLSEGDGRVIEKADLLIADYVGQLWDGDIFDNSFERPDPAAFPIGVSMVIPGWDQGLVGQKIGSRVLLSIPSELGYAEGNPGAGIEKGDTIVFVVDIINAIGAQEAGDPAAKVKPGAFDDLPINIEGDLGEQVSISVKDDAPAPTELVTTVLAEGSGAPVVEGQTALHFAVANWGSEGGVSTWDDGQVASMTLGGGTTYFDELVGVPVGSRVLVQIPASGGSAPMAVLIDVMGQPKR